METFSMNTKFSGKLLFLTPLMHVSTRAYQEVRKVIFSENFVNLVNGPL